MDASAMKDNSLKKVEELYLNIIRYFIPLHTIS